MPAYKGTKVLGTLKGGFHPKGTAPVAGMTGTRGPRTTDPKMVGKRTMGRATGDDIDPRNNSYTRAMTSSGPTAAERAASRKQDESLKKAKVTKQEGKVIESANRSEGSGMKKGGMMKMADKAGRAMKRKTADTMGRAMKMNKGGKCYAKGGSIDGIAKKGKTKGKMVKMALGGSLGSSLSGMGLHRMPVAAPKPSNMGANMMRRKKGGKC